MDDRLVVLSDDVDSKFLLQIRYIFKIMNKNTIGDLRQFKFIRLAFETFWSEVVTVDKSTLFRSLMKI